MNYLIPILLLFAVAQAWGQNLPDQMGGMVSSSLIGPYGVWHPLGNGLAGEKIHDITVMNDDLYVLHYNPDEEKERLSKWDGTKWTRVSLFDAGGYVHRIYSYRNNIYMMGSFNRIDTVRNIKNLARWDGVRWYRVEGGVLDEFSDVQVREMVEIDGALYCPGAYKRSEMNRTTLIRYDGTEWTEVGNPPNATPQDSFPVAHSVRVYKGELYLGGQFFIDGSRSLARWDGTRWSGVPCSLKMIHHMEVHGDDLYCSGRIQNPVEILSWNGQEWRDISKGTVLGKRFGAMIAEMRSYGGYLYAGLGDLDTSAVIRWDGRSWQTMALFDDHVDHLEILRNRLCAAGLFARGLPASDVLFDGLALFCDDRSCGALTGTVFNDADVDCSHDGTEEGMRRQIIEATPGPFYTATDDEGRYKLFLDPGNYTVRLLPRQHWNQTCPSSPESYTVTVAQAGQAVPDLSFAVRPVANIRDLRASMVAGPARAGRSLLYCITYENAGTVPMDGTLRLFLDPLLRFDSSAPPPTRVLGSLIEWEFTNLRPGEVRTIKVWTMVPRDAQRGTLICSDLRIDPEFPDFGIDDRDSVCVRVTGSYDPNDISVVPFGIEENGEITTEDSVLTYTVRFQNTGNDTAFRVIVIDTLSSHLDITSIRLGAASHRYSFSMSGSNILTWTFDEIMLPDSNASEPNSHGMFKYSVRQKPGLVPGTIIPNRAAIYFDYNQPVMTNSVESLIGGILSVSEESEMDDVRIVPNPARDNFEIVAKLRPGSVVEIRDLLGGKVMEMIADGGEMRVDVGGLAPGMYFVRIPVGSTMVIRRLNVMR